MDKAQLHEIRSRAFDYIDAHQTQMLELLKELVSIESSGENIAGVNEITGVLQQLCEQDNLKTRRFDFELAGSTLVAVYEGTNSEIRPVVLIGHSDTVFQKGILKEMPLALDAEKIYGPGVLDMKGGLVIGLYVIKALRAAGFCDTSIKFIVSGDEESGHENSQSHILIMEQATGASASFTLETGYLDNKIIIQRKGVGRFTMECAGRAAHAGICPENGRHAILDMAHKIIAIQQLNENEEGTTYNVGVITGGTVANSVPEFCRVIIDVRYTDVSNREDIKKKLWEIAAIAHVPDVLCQVSGNFSFSPMEPNEKNRALFDIVKGAAAELDYLVAYAGATGGGSDAACASAVNVPSVCAMGMQGNFSHTRREFAQIDSLYQRSKLLIATILRAREQGFI